MTFKQVLTGLQTSGGEYLKNVLKNYTNVEIIDPYGTRQKLFYVSTDGNEALFVYVGLGSYLAVICSTLNSTDASRIKRASSSNGAAPTDKTDTTISSDYVGTWKIVY